MPERCSVSRTGRHECAVPSRRHRPGRLSRGQRHRGKPECTPGSSNRSEARRSSCARSAAATPPRSAPCSSASASGRVARASTARSLASAPPISSGWPRPTRTITCSSPTCKGTPSGRDRAAVPRRRERRDRLRGRRRAPAPRHRIRPHGGADRRCPRGRGDRDHRPRGERQPRRAGAVAPDPERARRSIRRARALDPRSVAVTAASRRRREPPPPPRESGPHHRRGQARRARSGRSAPAAPSTGAATPAGAPDPDRR